MLSRLLTLSSILALFSSSAAFAGAPEGKSWLQKSVELQACMEAIANRAVREDVAQDYCLEMARARRDASQGR